jgi:biopolymer transport protein ExbB
VRVLALLAVAVLAGTAFATGGAGSEPGSSSFAGAFFFSRSSTPEGVMRVEWFGSILIWFLLLLSVVGIGILSSLAATNGRKAIAPGDQIERISDLVKQGSWKEALALTKNEKSDFSRIAYAALTEAPQGFSSMVHRAEQVSAELVTERLRKIEPLNVIGQVAPMIGLFGTVYGIIAFGSIVESGGNADPVALAGGIGTALVTTFWGLLVAIPALAGYAFVRNRVDALNAEAEGRTVELLERFKSRSSKRKSSKDNKGSVSASTTSSSRGSTKSSSESEDPEDENEEKDE